MYAHVSRWEFQPGRADEVLRRFERQMLPILRSFTGFHSYEVIMTAPDHALSISRWDTESWVAAIREMTRDWVAKMAREQVIALHTTAERRCPVVAFVARPGWGATEFGDARPFS